MLDLLLIATLGFLGSFGHCIGMCGPLTVAFSLSQQQAATTETATDWQRHLYFHGLLNLGRILSYALVGGAIGAVGSALVAGGQFAGIDSALRQWLAIFTGCLLVWMGLSQIAPGQLPHLPFLHPLLQGETHKRLTTAMVQLSFQTSWWTPALLGMVWGLIPCGFLYAAQVKAAETGNLWSGAMTMLAFGVGTLPSMVAVGVSSSRLSRDRRSQLFRLGGWITLTIGILTLVRSGQMVDYTGHAALICLILALSARPISHLWSLPLKYRRVLGVGAFILAVAHMLHMLTHTLDWNINAVWFMLPTHQVAIWLGTASLALMTPAALTSTDAMMQRLGHRWRQLHLLAVPALVLATSHTILIGSHYLGGLGWTLTQKLASILLGLLVFGVLLLRWSDGNRG